jgi:hypothetical protein
MQNKETYTDTFLEQYDKNLLLDVIPEQRCNENEIIE